MLNTKFLVTLIIMIVMLVGLGSTTAAQFTENYMHASGYCKGNRGLPLSAIDQHSFGAWAGAGQFMTVGGTPVSRGGQPICVANTKLGYQASECGVREFPTGMSTKRNMQSVISPRFNAEATPAQRFRPPPVSVMANNPNKPIDNQIEEMASMAVNSDNSKKVVEKYVDYESAQVPLPKDMCNINVMGTESQPVVYDRLMYSNMRSRLRGQGDYIRGDVQIVPDNYKAGYQHNNWFQVSVKPERDLNPGAMEHLFGRKEELSLETGQGDLCVPTYGL